MMVPEASAMLSGVIGLHACYILVLVEALGAAVASAFSFWNELSDVLEVGTTHV